ncbi:hypothetical protein E3E12_03010 [Formicincola oecophyllae]|uniref:Uncharacterized protein n=1 Tax=Formicincola oecophyllae TaxID=2558361 RepID=A0A4Y6UAD6_9PROT|nr:hypothetical protein [Formicincola oecophyllae]QDH13341.1 hypothetical protein E3E12_03010 [Formicincola oecophyllae]
MTTTTSPMAALQGVSVTTCLLGVVFIMACLLFTGWAGYDAARRKGRHPLGWAILCVLLGPLALMMLEVLPPRDRMAPYQPMSWPETICVAFYFITGFLSMALTALIVLLTAVIALSGAADTQPTHPAAKAAVTTPSQSAPPAAQQEPQPTKNGG